MQSPALFTILFAAVIDVILRWFCKESGIVANYLYLGVAPILMGPEAAMTKVVRST